MSEHNHEHHVSSVKQLWSVGTALFILTILTVVVSNLGLPAPFDIISALIIAFGKAYLVAAFFMGLYWDNKFNTLLLIGAFVFFIIMVTITMLDTMFRNDVVPSF
ncbi:MAG: hypothetical protein ED557_04495 [Balneola sp.]|nr:MAG: hypothetical protein ED557_04495 [Balneola sp.]